MEWRKHGDEWWLVPEDAPESLRSESGVLYPPSMSIAWGGPDTCCHLYSYMNGYHPEIDAGTGRDDDVEYLHVCNVDDLIAELESFKVAAGWQPAAWERES
jgi:hypothetical protein